MNKAMVVAADWAFVAGLLNGGKANVFVTADGKITLTVFMDSKPGQEVAAWLRSQGRKVSIESGRNRHRIRCRFTGSEAIVVLGKTYDRLHGEGLRRRADLAFRWWRTIQKRGQRLPREMRVERDAVTKEFERLKTWRVNLG